MSTSALSDERAILKAATALLLLAMTIRHAEFYLFPQGMFNEMGWRQPWIGVPLIPVTAAFGCLMFWQRGLSLRISNYDKCRFALIAAIPVLIAVYRGQLLEALCYSYLDPSRRPSFLMLLPIGLSILTVALRVWLRAAVLLACGLGAMLWHNFIAYYVFLFLLFGISQGLGWYRRLIGSWLMIPLYVVAVASIFAWHIERINMLGEFLFASAFLGVVFGITRQLAPIAVRVARWPWVAGCGTLYFYIAQGLLFTGFKALNLTEPVVPVVGVVFVLALFGGWRAKRWDKALASWVHRSQLARQP
jgi:hypothetical protein